MQQESAEHTRRLSPTIVAMLRKDLPEQLAACHEYLDAGESGLLAQEVHRIKGTAAFCGFDAMRTQCSRIEEGLQAKQAERELRDSLHALEEETLVVLRALP